MITFTSLSQSLPVDAEWHKSTEMKGSSIIVVTTYEKDGVGKHYEWDEKSLTLKFKVFKDGECIQEASVRGVETFFLSIQALKIVSQK